MRDARERDVIRAFLDLSNELVDGYDMVDLLTQLTANCTRLLDVASAGLLLADSRGVLHLIATSSERTHDLEVLQLQRDEGPCLDCYRLGEPVLVPDLAAEGRRWPRFVARATAAGFASVHAVPMRLRDNILGALGLFGNKPGRLDQDDLALAQALAHVASVAIVNEKAASDRDTVNDQLQLALESRIVIEQAKGVIAYVGELNMNNSFTLLRRYARDHDLRLSDVSTRVANRQLPGILLIEHARALALFE
jgi:GAF domain-containing protein